MANSNLDRSLGFLLHDVSRLLRKRFDRRARALGLTRAQWSVIAHLRRNEGLTQSALADILEVEKITLCRLVDRLEAAGWVERRPHPEDRRANALYLTPKAYPILDRMGAISQEIRTEAMSGLRPEEQEHLLDTLLRLKQNLLEREGAEPPGGTGSGPSGQAKRSCD
ncbi:MAG: MarR family transcriptional regulator [Gammaproteobacteria bacterium]